MDNRPHTAPEPPLPGPGNSNDVTAAGDTGVAAFITNNDVSETGEAGKPVVEQEKSVENGGGDAAATAKGQEKAIQVF